MNISAHLDIFKQEMKRRNYCENTIKNYSSCLILFLQQSKSDHPKNIHENEIREYLGKFKTPNTQRSVHGAIKKYFEICLHQKNKFRYIPYCRKEKKLPIVLSQDEIQKMFDVCCNLKHKVILCLLYSCSIRVSELINLKWEHIERSRKVINVIAGKGKKDRQVPLPNLVIDLLEKYYFQYKSKPYVLSGQLSDQYSSRSVGEVIKSLAKKAGIKKDVWTHLIRHTSATHLLESGTDISIIQKILGHTSTKTTHIYTHISGALISNVNSPINHIRL